VFIPVGRSHVPERSVKVVSLGYVGHVQFTTADSV
jgi:hypothetical protein